MNGQNRSWEELDSEILGLRRRLARLEPLQAENRALKKELARSEAILVAAIEQAPVGFVVLEVPEQNIRVASLAAFGIIGKGSQGNRNLDTMDYFQGWEILRADKTPYTNRDRPLELAALRGEVSQNVEAIIKRPDGQERWVLVNATPVRDAQGEIIASVSVFHDITQIKDLESERRRTLSFFAHDMKSPLMAISGLLQRLQADKGGELEPKTHEYLRIIKNQADRVLTLAQDFLDVARLDRPGSELPKIALDLNALLPTLAAEFEPLARERGLKLKVSASPSLPQVSGDPQRLERVLDNLLSNAIKFSQTGQVELRAQVTNDNQVKLEVLDEGPGLTDEDLPKLFQPFSRGSAGRGTEGTGLGLAAVKAIVEAHGGRVSAHNRPAGGASFTVRLPVGSGL